MKEEIKNIDYDDFGKALKIFREAFSEYNLHIELFPEQNLRYKLTEFVYEFVIFSLVPSFNMKIKGYYLDDILVSTIIYTTPESNNTWTEKLQKDLEKMKENAKDKRIDLIGQYAFETSKRKPLQPHFYINELATKKSERKKGFGKKLLLNVEEECIKSDTANIIQLDNTEPDNLIFYKKLGFKIIDSFNFYRVKSYVMNKTLTKK